MGATARGTVTANPDVAYGEITFDRSRWKPPERLSLSEWATKHYYLSAESAAESGRWRPYPYQVGIMNAISDPRVEQITWMKSARVGATKILNAMVGYYMHQDPCAVLIVQPTVEDAEGYSKEEIAPMLRDCPALAGVFRSEGRAKTTADTILHKIYPGGSISMVGANSGRGLRRVSRKVVGLDEVDAYPFSAGSEGDPIKLAIRRTEHFWDRKIYLGSTPLAEGLSRIAEEYEASDKRRYYVPCPHCGHFDFLVFSQRENGGHWMRWPSGSPEKAHFVCFDCGCEIAHDRKRDMVENGDWRAAREFKKHAGFHIWAAYSYSPNATWGQIAQEFDASNKAGPQKLKTFVNTVLGETWRERGEAPDYERLFNRREDYPPRTVPEGVLLITCGVDVQKDRIYYEVVGWGLRRENWSIDVGVFYGDTAREDEGPWLKLDELLAAEYVSPTSGGRRIQLLAIDSGNFTQAVYRWARRYPLNRVIAVKGDNQPHPKALINPPSKVDVSVRGKRLGYSVWTVGGSIAKGELYGWLSLDRPEEGNEFPPGYCHFPEHEHEFFKQLTGEHLVTTTNKRGFTVLQWQKLPGRENHWLDCRVYARAAASLAGLDRMRDTPAAPRAKRQQVESEQAPTTVAERRPNADSGKPKRSGGFFGGRRGKWL